MEWVRDRIRQSGREALKTRGRKREPSGLVPRRAGVSGPALGAGERREPRPWGQLQGRRLKGGRGSGCAAGEGQARGQRGRTWRAGRALLLVEEKLDVSGRPRPGWEAEGRAGAASEATVPARRPGMHCPAGPNGRRTQRSCSGERQTDRQRSPTGRASHHTAGPVEGRDERGWPLCGGRTRRAQTRGKEPPQEDFRVQNLFFKRL